MNTQDKLTQLYADAFSDYKESPPQEVYSKVRKELNRKSLLTLDPTRLNVFYLALLSGVAALALVNLNTTTTAETEVSPLPSSQEAVYAVNIEVDKTEEVEIEDPQIVKEIPKANSLEDSKNQSPVIQNVEYNKPIEESFVEVTEQVAEENEVDVETIDEMQAEIPEVQMITDESVAVDAIEVTDIVIKPSWSVENATVESPEDLLRALKLDGDNNVNLGIKKK